MSCCNEAEIIDAVRRLFYARLVQRFNGMEIPLTGGDGWWTGTWDGGRWSGERYVSSGVKALVSVSQQGNFTVTFYYSLKNLGSWDDVYPPSESS